MKKFITVLLMTVSCISCNRVMDLTPENETEITYDKISLSLFESGEFNVSLDISEYTYTIMISKTHCEKDAVARFDVVPATEFGKDYVPLPQENYVLEDMVEFKENDVFQAVELRIKDISSLDESGKYVLGLRLVSEDVDVDAEKSMLVFYLKPKQGGATSPYIISTVEELLGMSKLLADGKKTYIRLGADINMQGHEWIPVETSLMKSVDFDGCGYTISNLTVNASTSAYQGFFGALVGRCANVRFKDAIITADKKLTGIVAGTVGVRGTDPVVTGEVYNCSVSGLIKLTSPQGPGGGWDNGQAGGICGLLHGAGSKISRCSSTAILDVYWSAGGIAGEVRRGALVEECWFDGKITTTSCAGGIASRLLGAEIKNCYSKGTLKATEPFTIPNPAGGIAGWVQPVFEDVSTATISYCWSSCHLTAQNWVGSIMGYANNTTGNGVQIHHCAGWSPYIRSVAAPKSGRIGGRPSENVSYACYANPAMVCEIKNNPSMGDQASQNTGDDDKGVFDRYNGLSTMPTLMAAVDALQWDNTIWNLDGAEPRLMWETSDVD